MSAVSQVWQNVQTSAALAQFVLYLTGFNNYKNKLEDIADELENDATAAAARYQELRNKDPEFHTYYDELPEYEQCDANIKRSRGAATARYGDTLRRTYQTNNGYTPLRNVAVANLTGKDMAISPSIKRAQTIVTERARQDDHVLERWQAIIAAPTHAAANNDSSAVIQASFRSLSAFGQGANSAGVALGTQLFARDSGLNGPR